MVDLVNKKRHNDINSLKEAIQDAWDTLDEEFVKHASTRFRSRLERVLDGNGEYLC